MVTKLSQQYTHKLTRNTGAEAPTFHYEYTAQQWRTQDFWMALRSEQRRVETFFCIFLFL